MKTIIDLGCGDGKQIFREARKNPESYYIGIDPAENYRETEKKAAKKTERGGLSNLEFVKAFAEDLPDDLENSADEIQINFPWGSLLEGVVKAETSIMQNIVKIAKDKSELKIFLTYGDNFEEKYKEDRSLPELDLKFIENQLTKSYKDYKIDITESKILDETELRKIDSPWGKKITSKRKRPVFYIQGIINKKI